MRLHGLKKLFYGWFILLITSSDALAVLNVDVKKAPDKKPETGEVDLKKTTAAYSVIHAENTQGRYVNLGQLIEQEVGVQVRSAGGFGGFSSAELRGASSQQVIVYLDGVALNDASTGTFDLSNIPIDNIDRIEVYRGVTPIELSNASIGGAINIITKKATKLSSADLKLTLGSLSTRKLSASYNKQFSQNKILMAADYLESENDYEILFDNGTEFNERDDFLTNVNNNQVKQSSALFKWNRLLDANSNIDMRLKIFSKEKHIPSANNSPDINSLYSTDSSDFLTQITRNDLWGGVADLNVKLDYYTVENIYDDRAAELGFFDQLNKYETKKMALQSFIMFKGASQDLKWLLGGSQEKFKYRNELRDREKSQNTRELLELGLDHRSYYYNKSLTISLGYRYQNIEDNLDYAVDIFDNEVAQRDKNYTTSDPQFGLRYDYAHNLYFVGNIGRYSRIPTFFELFGDQGVFGGNAELKEESSINADVGFNYEFYKPWHWLDETTLYIGLFHNVSENLIVREYSPQGFAKSENIDDAVITGFEFQLKMQPKDSFNINFNMSLLDSVIESSVRSSDGNRLPGQYAQKYNLYLGYKINNWQVALQQNYERDLYLDKSNSIEGEDVYTVDISFYRKWKKYSFEFRVNNLTDTNYYQVIRSRPLPGTVYLATFQYYFNEMN